MAPMRRRIAALVLTMLVVLPAVAPVSAAGPSHAPKHEPSASPPITPGPTDPRGTDPATTDPATTDPATNDGTPPADLALPPDPSPSGSETPAVTTAADEPTTDAAGRPIAAGRFIVMLKSSADTTAVMDRVSQA